MQLIDERTEMPYGLWTRVGPNKARITHGKVYFQGHTFVRPGVQYIRYKLSPRGGETICPPADDSSTCGGSTSVRGRIRSPHISGGRLAAGSQRADSLVSCTTQPACYSLGWDGQTGRTDGRIAVSLNAPLRLGIIINNIRNATARTR